MDDRLEPVRDVVDPYIDDILTGTKRVPGESLWELHYKDVRRVLTLLRQEQFVCDQRKIQIFVEEVDFCGYILGKGQRRPAPGKLGALNNGKYPKQLQL